LTVDSRDHGQNQRTTS